MILYLYVMVLRSEHYDDVYFSAQDGLAETRHVFLDGNDLPAAFDGHDVFVVGETGFGTGLNFLAVWDLFEREAAAGQKLRFVSFEKFPLKAEIIRGALSQWGELGERLDQFLDVYRPEGGVFEVTDRVSVQLYVGDVCDHFPAVDEAIDCWFLDGFNPANNPDMWNDDVLTHVGRVTKSGGSFATFTAAGFVRRGLEAAGFSVRKIKGFGRKREMSVGVKL